MPYATHADLVARFGAREILQLADRDRDGAEDVGVVDLALSDAAAEIDTYLVAVYALPLAAVPPALARVCCDIARYRLYGDRALEEVRDRYRDAVAWLVQVSKGVAKLGMDPPPAASADDPTAVIDAVPRVFSGGLLSDY